VARIDPKLIERLRSTLSVGRSQLYKRIDKTSREMHIPRHFAAIALAASHGINVSRFASDDYYAAIRGATGAGGGPPHTPPAPPARPEARGPRRAKAPRQRQPGRLVFVVHGRDENLRRSIFDFIRAVGLTPLEWSKARAMTGKPNPVISEILDTAFARAAAVVVVLSPDDEAKLADHFIRPSDPAHERRLAGQPRANVLWEGGMAYSRSADRTVLVQVGKVRPFSDIAGHHILHLTDAPEDRTEFVARLRSAKCEVDTDGRDWLRVGTFQAAAPKPRPSRKSPRRKPRRPSRRAGRPQKKKPRQATDHSSANP
jgi:predicted nucleotide-binding protein